MNQNIERRLEIQATVMIIFLGLFLNLVVFYPWFKLKSAQGPNQFLTYSSEIDELIYKKWITQSQRGSWLLKIKDQTQSSNIFIQPLYIVLGKISRITHFSTQDVYLVAKAILIFTAVFSLFKFTACFFKGFKHRLLFLLLALFSTGLGGLEIFWKNSELPKFLVKSFNDHWTLIEGNTFLLIKDYPHMILGFSLLIFWWLCIFKAIKHLGFKDWLLAGMIGFFSACNLPFVTVGVSLTVLLFFSINKKLWHISQFFKLALFTTLANLPVLYYWYLYNFDPVLSISPPLFHYRVSILGLLVLFGYLPILTLIGINRLKQNGKLYKPTYQLMLIWLILGFVFIFLPLPQSDWMPQARRWMFGIHIPLVLFGSVVITNALQNIKSIISKIILGLTILLVITSLSTIFVSIDKRMDLINKYPDRYYRSKNYFEGINWLYDNCKFEETVLAGGYDSLINTAYSGVDSFFGYAFNSDQVARDLNLINIFFLNTMEENEKLTFVLDHDLYYIFVNKKDPLFKQFRLEDYEDLLLFENSAVKIYRIHSLNLD